MSNTQKGIVRGDTRADKVRDIIGKGRPGREQEGQGAQENCSATWLTVSGFMVGGLVSGLSLAWPIFGLTQGPSWWCTHLAAKMNSSARASGRLAGISSPPSSFWPLPNSPHEFSVAAPCSLSGPPAVTHLVQVAIILAGKGRQFRSAVP